MKKIWSWLDGKKLLIGTAIRFAGMGVSAFFPHLMTQEQVTFVITIGDVIAGVGGLHKLAKTETAKNMTKNFTTNRNKK
jgi:hypothetical protein